MRFLISMLIFALLVANPLFSHEFSYKQDTIYMLDDEDFKVRDGDVIIDLDRLNAKIKSNEAVGTAKSNVVIDDNLDFYYYSRSNSLAKKDDLLRVRSRTGGYFTRVKARKNGDKFVLLSEGGNLKAPKNCYIVIRGGKKKTLATKSSAMVLDLDNKSDFEDLDTNPLTDAYFGCFGNQQYIF